MDENMRVMEINGIKVEKVGDNVKVLKKGYSGYQVYSGVVVDFVNFKERPAIVVAYFEQGYNGVDIRFETITKDTQGVEIAPCLPHELKINKDRVVDKFNIAIAAKEREADDLRQKRDYFVQNFARFFEEAGDEKDDTGLVD